jgi:hypothetical protein
MPMWTVLTHPSHVSRGSRATTAAAAATRTISHNSDPTEKLSHGGGHGPSASTGRLSRRSRTNFVTKSPVATTAAAVTSATNGS